MTKVIAVLAVLGAGLAAVSIASCSVHRQSDAYACTTTDDCHDGRSCEQGFCVNSAAAMCPSPCQSCDLEDMTCRIECTSGRPCGPVHCPPGFDCTIRCNNNGACGTIDCASAAQCDIDCSGPGSCGGINCGSGACAIQCSGAGACPTIDCAASCKCDVDCNNPAIACPSMSCPDLIGPCTEQGSAGAPCSSAPAGCDLCF